jgi:prepilin-type N-terminal cleavage/methylation domain-containing protein
LRASHGDGFTLTEVLVTVVVVSLALSGLIAMQVGTTKANVDAMNYYRALSYAEELMEETEAAEWRLPCPSGNVEGNDDCDAVSCDGSTDNLSPTSVAGPGCFTPAELAYNAPLAGCGAITGTCCDTLGYLWSNYTDQIVPNSVAGCVDDGCTANEPSATNYRQNCDRPRFCGGVWKGGPSNPTDMTFTRRVCMQDIDPLGVGAPFTLRRISVEITWDDAVSLARGQQHRIVLETERTRN